MMPLDSWGSMLEGEMSDIDEFIQWVGDVLNNAATAEPLSEQEEKANRIGQKLLRQLRQERELKQFQLDSHRQRDRDLGIKY